VITIISVEGRVVTARLAAHQADGSTKKYEGEYTVIHGVIADVITDITVKKGHGLDPSKRINVQWAA